MSNDALLSKKTIVLAAGGTGGHIFPAEALAEVLASRGYAVHLITDHRFFHYNQTANDGVFARIPIHTIRSGSLGGGILKKCLSLAGITVGTVQALVLLRTLNPCAVVGFGGYPSFPTMLAAMLRGDTTIIHEQNSVLGRANRVLARRVKAIAATYSAMQYNTPNLQQKTRNTGNPVRASIQALQHLSYPAITDQSLLHVLVIGGSQGASVFSETVPAAMALLPADVRGRIRLDQQCRAQEIDNVREAYAALNMQVDVAPFFTDVAARMASAHIVISRAGASSVAELSAAGRPTIFVPLPTATDNHQYHNAEAVEDVGGGWVMAQEGFTPQALAAKLETMVRMPKMLTDAAERMRSLGQPNAAEMLADYVMECAV